MATIDLGNIRINWRGPYDNAAPYVRDDAVSYQGSSFIAKGDVTGVTPVQGDDWDTLAAGTDQLTQEGDLLIHNGAIPARLARGNNAQVLQMIGNQPAWRNQSLDPSRRVWKLGKVNRHGGWYTRTYLMANGIIKACGYGGNYSNGSHIYLPNRMATDDPDVRFVDVFSGGMQHYGSGAITPTVNLDWETQPTVKLRSCMLPLTQLSKPLPHVGIVPMAQVQRGMDWFCCLMAQFGALDITAMVSSAMAIQPIVPAFHKSVTAKVSLIFLQAMAALMPVGRTIPTVRLVRKAAICTMSKLSKM